MTLLNRGTPIADIVPHVQRAQWLPGSWLQQQLPTRQADPALTAELDELVDQDVDFDAMAAAHGPLQVTRV